MAEIKEELKETTEEIKETTEEIREKAGDISGAIAEEAADLKADAAEAADGISEKIEDVKEDIADAAADFKENAAEAADDISEKIDDNKEEAAAKTREMKASTEAKRQKKAERRDAKAARKEANKAEDRKSRPNNILLAILIFGVVIVMFSFSGVYNYFSKPASIEKYMDANGITEMYNNAPVSEHTTMTMKADGNTLKIWIKADEEATDEELAQYEGEEGKESLENMGAYFLTSMKPEVRGFGATCKIKVQKGDETINYVEMSYGEAKDIVKEAEEKAQEEAEENADADAETEEDAGEETDGE